MVQVLVGFSVAVAQVAVASPWVRRLPRPLTGMRWEGKQVSYVVANVSIAERSHAKHPLSKTWTEFTVGKIAIDISKTVHSVDANWACRLELDYQWRLRAERDVVESVEYALIGSDWNAFFTSVRSVKDRVTSKNHDESSIAIVGAEGATHSVYCPFIERDAVSELWVELIAEESCINICQVTSSVPICWNV